MTALEARLSAALASRRDRAMLRSLDPVGVEPRVALVDFSSNDYLSLSRSTTLRERLVERLSDPSSPSPYGPPSSRLLDGNSPAHLALELALARFFNSSSSSTSSSKNGEPGSALLFNSGFDANKGLWACLPGARDYIIYDELVHASIHDGMRSSRVPPSRRISIRHNDLRHLDDVLRRIRDADADVRDASVSVWIAVESLYSMDGDLVPLRDMVDLVEQVLPRRNGHFVVDEAHSTGLYGDKGRGLVCALGLEDKVTVRVHTFGKAMACSGAVVLASPLIRNYLINYARPLIYSTVTPHMNVKAIEGALEMLEQGQGEEPAARVHSLAATLISRLTSFLDSTSSVHLPPHLLPPMYPPRHPLSSLAHPPTSPIVPLLTSAPRPMALFLRDKGFLVRPITYPTVPKGMERVRVCLHAGNTTDEVERLAEGVHEWVQLVDRPSRPDHAGTRAKL
ncbi:hypothetical protein JCM10212_000336 [Sporobolomyces blumeae]